MRSWKARGGSHQGLDVLDPTQGDTWIQGRSGGMPRSLRSGPSFRLHQGPPWRWLSRAMPGSARLWYGSTYSRLFPAHRRYCLVSRPQRRDRSRFRRLMTCWATSPGRSFRCFPDRGGEPWRSHFSATRPLNPCRLSLPGASRPQPELRMLARGVLDVVRLLSGSAPLMIAVDDAQWLDRPSAGVLEFCFRRLRREPVSILLTFRNDDGLFPLGLGRALPPDRLRRMPLGPLSLGAIGKILRSRLGIVLPLHALTRLYDTCGGNPFYALECARTLSGRPDTPLTNEPIPIPHSLSDLVRHRVRGLTPEVRRLGRLVAASSDPRERQIRAACSDEESWAAIDQAVDAGLIERDGDALRFTHPLLRSVLYSEMPLKERRHVHQRLGAAAEDIERRAWHLALGADRPSEEIAGILDGAARHAASRGAPEEAATLMEQAARLTPAGRSEAARERMVHAADYHFRAGDIAHSRELIDSVLPACPAAAPRVAAPSAGHDLLPPERLAAGRADVPPGSGGSAG